ncbi:MULTISPECIES: MotE family protein [Palleronia]|nr:MULTISPECIES: hypothetical protein [Palleronia]
MSPPKLVIAGLLCVVGVKAAAVLMPTLTDGIARSGQAFAAEEALPAQPAAKSIIDAPVCESSDAIVAAIAEERELLNRQRQEMADREAEAQLAEDSLRAERERLATLRDAIEGQIARVEEAYNQDLTKLVALYQNMKPEIASGIMDEMDIETATLVLSAMPERDAAQILGKLNLNRARAISKIILERSRLPGDQNLSGLKLQ